MARYAAFLRGMNLGRRRITNDELCKCFVTLGFEDVSAFLASGNVMFTATGKAAEVEREVERGLEAQLHYAVPTFVRSAREVAAAASREPFDVDTVARLHGKLQVAFMAKLPSAKASKTALALATDEDALALVGRELYWLPAGNMSDSELPLGALEAALGTITIRTQRTVARLSAKLVG